jgi:phenylpropionate dioxygenase-like ring-hydroxylating dioxygenase large terminal subunit
MFTALDNEELTRVGRGTVMGDYMRRFWMPVLKPEELPTPDCPPVRVRLLGEDLIAFRDTNGRLGLLDRYCPHRRVDLWFGRNEECGLRCIYHGWKFDTDGNVMDMPAEPANSPLRTEIKTGAYPIVEWGGLIWAFLGDRQHMPEVPPELEWGLVDPAHRHIGKRLQENNWAQGVEGGIDSSHVGILHSLLVDDLSLPFHQRQRAVNPKTSLMAVDRAPRFFIRPTEFGMRIGARRIASDAEYYWRITQFLLPFYTMIARPSDTSPIAGHAWVPIDDYNTWTFTMHWNPTLPLGDITEFDFTKVNVKVVPDGSYRPFMNRSNDYGIDREVQRRHSTSGIDGIGLQDSALQETMGAIVDRTKENLGSGDTAIVSWRRLMLEQARKLRDTGECAPPLPEAYRTRSVGIILPRETDFEEGAREKMRVA